MAAANPALEGEQHQRIQNAGKQLLVHTYSLMKTGEIHDLNNDAYERPCEKLIESLEVLMKLERQSISVVVYEGVAQVNSHALWLDPATQELAQELEQWLARREAGGLIFAARPSEDELRRFFFHFARFRAPADTRSQFKALAEHLTGDGIARVKLAPQPVRLDGLGQGIRGVASLWHYAKAVAGMRILLRRVPTDVKQARRLALELVDSAAGEQDLFQSMPLLGTVPHDTARQSVDAAILVAATARGLGLTAVRCCELTLSTLLAEMGVARENPDPNEFTDLEAASTLAIRHLQECAEISTEVLRRTTVAIEHLLGPSLTGPPHLPAAPSPHLETQLAALAHTWLDLVRGRAQREPISAVEATLSLLRSPPRNVDPNLVMTFAAILGPLPVGTVVELHNGDLGVVSEVDHLRGRAVYRAEVPPVAGPRKVFVQRMRTSSGQLVPERQARVRLGDDDADGTPWRVARTLASAGWEDLVTRALLQRPSTVVMQMGLRT